METPKSAPDPNTVCPNCGQAWPPGAAVCPHCGFVRPGASAAWPPPPGGLVAPPPPPVSKLVTGRAWGDITLGIGLSVVSCFLLGLGFILMPILYFTLRPKYPVFARGLGYGFLAGVALLLGAFALCLVALSSYKGG